jgi:hypothetical protein
VREVQSEEVIEVIEVIESAMNVGLKGSQPRSAIFTGAFPSVAGQMGAHGRLSGGCAA